MSINMKAFRSNLKMIAARGAKLQALIHDTAVMALTHAAESGDAKPCDFLLSAIPEGFNRKGLVMWFGAFSPIYWNADKIVTVRPADSKFYIAYDVAKANASPYWTLDAVRKDQEPREINAAILQAMISKYVKLADEADASGDVSNKDGAVKVRITGNVVEFRRYMHALEESALKLEAESKASVVVVAEKPKSRLIRATKTARNQRKGDVKAAA